MHQSRSRSSSAEVSSRLSICSTSTSSRPSPSWPLSCSCEKDPTIAPAARAGLQVVLLLQLGHAHRQAVFLAHVEPDAS
jgi:hypothetical protein